MSVWSILMTAATTGLPSSPLTSPSMDEVWAGAKPAKQAANKRATGSANSGLRGADCIFFLQALQILGERAVKVKHTTGGQGLGRRYSEKARQPMTFP